MTRAAAFHWLDPRRAHQRLLWAVVIGVVAWFVSPPRFSPVTRGLLSGDAAGLGLLVIVGWLLVRAASDDTRRRAAAYDPGRTLVWLVVLLVSGVSLFAATFVLRHAKSLPGDEGHLLTILAVATTVISWLLTHTAYTL